MQTNKIYVRQTILKNIFYFYPFRRTQYNCFFDLSTVQHLFDAFVFDRQVKKAFVTIDDYNPQSFIILYVTRKFYSILLDLS